MERRLKKNKFLLISLSLTFVLIGCMDAPRSKNDNTQLFLIISAEDSGLEFVNHLEETLESNYYQYLYTYIGGGVAAGDINNDGLVDLFFTANTSGNKLYLNRGNLQFEDISAAAGIYLPGGFNTGVSMADVNQDGFLDIYIARGGKEASNKQFANLLFINNGDLTFTESAEERGLADTNRSIQASFFDYDRDGDLDMYLANTPDVTGRSKLLNLKEPQDNPALLAEKGSDRLYENDGKGYFKDVSEEAGLLFDLGFGLNPQVIDLNEDGWLDIYVCNDFSYPDLVYLNNGDKTFSEARDQVFKHMSFNSMGSDFADLNHDGHFDLMTLDMNPEDYIRSKTTMTMTSVSRFETMVNNGYHHQYMHNMLQLNNGNGTYREISNMAGIANTDWSWALLLADFNLDGWEDIYVTNGVYRDVLDQDTNSKIKQLLKQNGRKPTKEDFLQFTQMLPQQKLRNYFFRNNSDLSFDNVSELWAEESPTFSNGAIYADLDNDGDLEIIVNNINDEVTLLKNNAVEQGQGNFLVVKLQGPPENSSGIGAKMTLFFEDGSSLIRQHIASRGYLSAVTDNIHFGFKNRIPTGLEIEWPDGSLQILKEINTNSQIIVDYQEGKNPQSEQVNQPLFTALSPVHEHVDPYFNDFNVQILLPHKLSQTGPFMAQADINGDLLPDLFIGGAYQQAGQILLGKGNGQFQKIPQSALINDANYEDQGAVFFDADNDGDQDLYVVSGSYEFYQFPRALQDRLYLNDGKGNFLKTQGQLPNIESAGSVVRPFDFDQDGDLDLFVGGRVLPGKYPYAPASYLLINEEGTFKDRTADLAPDLNALGMITDAKWTNIDKDDRLDLVLCGEWLGIEVFSVQKGQLKRNQAYEWLSEQKGWWNQIILADIDEDGDQDIIAGNLGLNSKFHVSPGQPFRIYTDDFDANGTEDILLAKEVDGKEVPIRGKTCMTQQLPYLAERVNSYNEFAEAGLQEIIGADLEKSLHFEASEFRSGIFKNKGNKEFEFEPFPSVAQTAPINSIIWYDFDKDQKNDLLLAGNNYHAEVETTRYDAGISTLLLGNGKGRFKSIPNSKTGLFLHKDIRDMKMVTSGAESLLLVIHNNSTHDLYNLEGRISTKEVQ